MNPIPIPNGLCKEANALLNIAADGAVLNFTMQGQVMPAILFIKQERMGLIGTPTLTNSDKDHIAAILGNLRRDCEAVVMVTEAWLLDMSKHPDAKYVAGQNLENHPCRSEVITVNLYIGKRMLAFDAPIMRHPDRLGEWTLRVDSAVDHVEGRFVET